MHRYAHVFPRVYLTKSCLYVCVYTFSFRCEHSCMTVMSQTFVSLS